MVRSLGVKMIWGVGQVKFQNILRREPPQNLQMVYLVWVNAKEIDLKAGNQLRFRL